MASPSGYRGHDGQFIAVGHRRFEPGTQANVIIIEVKRDERIRLSLLISQAWRQLRVTHGRFVHDIAHGLTVQIQRSLSVSQPAQHGRQV
jgi:hypothetical protein